MAGTCNGMGGRRRHTKKHKRHSRRRMRGGTTLASFNGPLAPGLPSWGPSSMSGSEFTTPQVGQAAPDVLKGGRRRSRKTRRRHRRSMRGGTGGEGSGYGFGGPLTDSGVGSAQRVYVGAATGNHTVGANGYNGGHP